MDYRAARKWCDSRLDAMEREFDRVRPMLADIAKNIAPSCIRGIEKRVDHGEWERDEGGEPELLDPEPRLALARGAAGFHANLTSPARMWFKFGLLDIGRQNEESNDASDVRHYLDSLTTVCAWVMHESGIYKAIYKLYEHLLAFGFGAMLLVGDEDDIVSATTLRMGTYYLGVDRRGMVNSLVRRFAMDASQLAAEFTYEALPEEVRKCADSRDARLFTICNLIEPHERGGVGVDDGWRLFPDARGHAWRSVYWIESGHNDPDRGGMLQVRTFDVNPIIAPRFSVETGDVYGHGKGEEALPACRGLQAARADALEMSALVAQPPLVASSDFFDGGIRMGRGSVNYARTDKDAFIRPVITASNATIEVSRYNCDEFRHTIQKCFFNDLFTTILNVEQRSEAMTATEVEQRRREGMVLLGPVITSLDKEMLDPIVSGVRAYVEASGLMEHIPENKRGIPQGADASRIEYVSSIHLAQQAADLSLIERYFQFIGMSAQVFPQVLDNVDSDTVFRYYTRVLGMKERSLVRATAVEDSRRKQQAEQRKQIAQAQQMEDMKARADALSKAGSVRLDGTVAGALAHGGADLFNQQ